VLADDTKRLLEDVSAVVERLAGDPITGQPLHVLEIMGLFDRCRGLFGAVRVLTERGYGHEALILTRPLFTESLMLMELASVDETRRIGLVVGWMLESVRDFEGIMREAQSRGDDTSEQLAAMSGMRATIEAYARTHNAATRGWRINEKTLADKHRGGDGYLDFRVGHHFVHGSAFASAQRSTRRGDVTFIGGPAAYQGWTEAAALSAAQSMLFAVRGVCGVVGWPEPPEVNELCERLEALAEEHGDG
jgi:hypothetical protein